MAVVEPGGRAPAFSLPDQEGTVHRLRDYAGRPLILYFSPEDDTPGCTREACALRDALPDFKKGKAAVLGISVLDVARRWDDVKVDGHAADVRRAVDER
jgi:thioredoxin-dependent peroxiredoxin